MSKTAKKSTKRIPVTAKNATKVWNSLAVFFSYIIYYKILIFFYNGYLKSLNFIFGIIYFNKHYTNDDEILTLQQYYNEILILQQHFIHNVLNGHCKVPEIFRKPF